MIPAKNTQTPRTMLLSWLKWHTPGRKGSFRNPLIREAEIDTTTRCSGLPSCAKDCTYYHSRNSGLDMPPETADKILGQLYDAGIRRIIFSGGGEPLEPSNAGTFLKTVQTAHEKRVEIELITNGKFLMGSILPELLPHLSVLRISIPPFLHGYSHLQKIRGQLEAAITYRNDHNLKTKIVTSLLIRPDTPKEEIKDDINTLSAVGIDSIRFKPTHIRGKNGLFQLDIPAYKDIMGFIIGLNHPAVVVSKIDRLLEVEGGRNTHCYWADFNPLVIGADGKNYACCEQKYHDEYQRGDLNTQSVDQILESANQNPQPILPGCFEGCKGDLTNRYLFALIKGYASLRDTIFEHEEYRQLADFALSSMVRSSLIA